MLRAPGTKCLKLKCDKLHSFFAFHFNLRCYNVAALMLCKPDGTEANLVAYLAFEEGMGATTAVVSVSSNRKTSAAIIPAHSGVQAW